LRLKCAFYTLIFSKQALIYIKQVNYIKFLQNVDLFRLFYLKNLFNNSHVTTNEWPVTAQVNYIIIGANRQFVPLVETIPGVIIPL